MRGGRKSHAKLRGRGGRGQGFPPGFRESPESIEQESVPFPGKSTGNSRGRNGKASGGPRRPFTSGSPNQPLRPGAVNCERRQNTDS